MRPAEAVTDDKCPACGQRLGIQVIAGALYEFSKDRLNLAATLGERSGMVSKEEEEKAKAILRALGSLGAGP